METKTPASNFDINKKHQSDIYILDISKDFLIIQHIMQSIDLKVLGNVKSENNDALAA